VFRELLLPRVRKLCAKCHELGQVYVYRTDGDLRPIEQEFFVASGTDGYGEIDYEAGMDLDRLKPRHGDRITFWGNVPCGTILHHGTEAEVTEFTKHIIDVAAPGGGFILGSSNSVMPGTPARNVMAMVETALTYGR
jgi:uroporphyrinogen decarboxylase